jgi:hypothetical protein
MFTLHFGPRYLWQMPSLWPQASLLRDTVLKTFGKDRGRRSSTCVQFGLVAGLPRMDEMRDCVRLGLCCESVETMGVRCGSSTSYIGEKKEARGGRAAQRYPGVAVSHCRAIFTTESVCSGVLSDRVWYCFHFRRLTGGYRQEIETQTGPARSHATCLV